MSLKLYVRTVIFRGSSFRVLAVMQYLSGDFLGFNNIVSLANSLGAVSLRSSCGFKRVS